jgi:hypothetical protein
MILDELSIVASTQSPLPMGTIPKLVAQPTKLSEESPTSTGGPDSIAKKHPAHRRQWARAL